MKKLICLVEVPDKYTGEIYKVDNIYEFEDKRAKEVLAARTKITNEPYFEEYEEVTEEVVQAVASAIVEEAEETDKTVEEVVTEIVEETKPKKRKKNSTK